MAYVNIPASTGNISINVPSSQGRININTASRNDTTNVSLQGVQSFAVNKAKDWAEKMDGPIGNEGYSAKWHATEAQGHAEKAKEYSTEIIDLKDSMLQELIAIKEEVIENENINIIGENIEDINTNAENIEAIKDTAVLIEHIEKKSMPVGTIYQAIRTDIPEGSLRLDGTEFTTGFESFVTNYLATGKIISKSLAEWQTEYTMTNGNVGFFGYDSTTGKFKTPCIKAGTFLAQAIASGDFGSFLASSLKSHTHTQNAHTHSWSGTTSSSGAHTHSTTSAGGHTHGVYTNGTAESGSSFGLQNTRTSGISGGDNANTQTYVTTLAKNSAQLLQTAGAHTHTAQSAGAHTHTVSGTTGSTTPTINATGGDDTYPKHIRYPFFVVVSNEAGEQPSQVDWDNFVGNLDSRANLSLDNLDENGQAKFDAKADTSLNNLDSSGQAKFNAKVNKAGDTITGVLKLNVNKQYSDPINIICPEMDWTTAPTRNNNCGIHFYDKNGKVGPYFIITQSAGSTQNYFTIGYDSTNDPDFAGFNFPKATSKATTTSSATTCKPAVVTQNYVNGYSWYRVWSDGWKEQGGWCNRGTNVTYLKAFSNNNYTLVASGLSNSTNTGMAYNHVMPNAKTTTGFTGTPSNAVGLFWYACGY